MPAGKLVGPDVVQKRTAVIMNLPIWMVVDKVNKQLLLNAIKSDGSIEVYCPFPMEPTVLERIKKMYYDEGWSNITHEYIPAVNGFPVTTVVTFIP